MPTLARFGNIRIVMFSDDHNPPHFHVVAGEREAMIALSNLRVIQGRLRRGELDVALGWAAQNREFLRDEWERLQRG
jgi:hypothetical protein